MKLPISCVFGLGLGLMQCAVAGVKLPPVVAPIPPGVPSIPHLQKTENLVDAFKNGTPDLSFRLRDENVVQKSALREANALTLRTLLSLQSKSFYNFDTYLQFNNVSTPNDDGYNSTLNGQKAYSIIPDPYHTSVNQAYVGFSGVPATYVKVGRQIINLDNQRFVGAVAFRQNMQNFDAVSVVNQYIPNSTIFLAYLDSIDTVTTRITEANDVLINLKYHVMDSIDISPYAYLLDHRDHFNQPLLPYESTNTYGVRLNGHAAHNNITYLYTAEYANQDSAANNPLDFSAYYYHLGLGASWSILSLGIDQEVLSGKNNKLGNMAFRTPLATKHIFQGWADMFLVTPASGIIDTFLTAGVIIPPLANSKFGITYHDFDSQSSSNHFGHELDLGLSKEFDKRYTLGVEYADFISDMHKTYPNTQKLWLTVAASFA